MQIDRSNHHQPPLQERRQTNELRIKYFQCAHKFEMDYIVLKGKCRTAVCEISKGVFDCYFVILCSCCVVLYYMLTVKYGFDYDTIDSDDIKQCDNNFIDGKCLLLRGLEETVRKLQNQSHTLLYVSVCVEKVKRRQTTIIINNREKRFCKRDFLLHEWKMAVCSVPRTCLAAKKMQKCFEGAVVPLKFYFIIFLSRIYFSIARFHASI